jgi:hypothetical protein
MAPRPAPETTSCFAASAALPAPGSTPQWRLSLLRCFAASVALPAASAALPAPGSSSTPQWRLSGSLPRARGSGWRLSLPRARGSGWSLLAPGWWPGVSPCPGLEAPGGVSPCPGFRVTVASLPPGRRCRLLAPGLRVGPGWVSQAEGSEWREFSRTSSEIDGYIQHRDRPRPVAVLV